MTNNSLCFTDEQKLKSYPPTKEQFLNAWRDSEIVQRLRNEIDDIECSFDVGMGETLELLKSILDNKKQKGDNVN